MIASTVQTNNLHVPDLGAFVKSPLDKPSMYPVLEDEYQTSKEKQFSKQFQKYVSNIVYDELSVNSAILHSMAHITNMSIYDIVAMRKNEWLTHCDDFNYDRNLTTAGIQSITKKYCDFHMNFGDRIDTNGTIYRKRIPCASYFDNDCAEFITNRAISRILNYSWDTPHKSIVFTLDPAGWDMVTWDNIGDFQKLVNDVVDMTINQHFKAKHSRIKGHVSVGVIIIPHTFSSLDPTKWQPHFNVLVSCKGILDNSGITVDTSFLDYELLRKNYKELLYKRFGLFRKGNYQIEVSEIDRKLSDSSFVDILRYNKRAPISDSDIIAIHPDGIEFTTYKREKQQEPNLYYTFEQFFNGIMQHLPPKNKVQIHRYGLYHPKHHHYKKYPVSFDSSQSTLSDYEGKTWLWTAHMGRIVAYNAEYLENNIDNLQFIDHKDRSDIVGLIREDSQSFTHNKIPDVCRILTSIVYNLPAGPPDKPGEHKNFSFFEVGA